MDNVSSNKTVEVEYLHNEKNASHGCVRSVKEATYVFFFLCLFIWAISIMTTPI